MHHYYGILDEPVQGFCNRYIVVLSSLVNEIVLSTPAVAGIDNVFVSKWT